MPLSTPTPPAIADADLFCRVIDNFGDIGVCWRLARQLANEYGLQVRLWVDDLITAARLIPALAERLPLQNTPEKESLKSSYNNFVPLHITHGPGQVWLHHWPDGADVPASVMPARRVIEAFACELPASYRAALRHQTPPACWLNLEYLSAESWVAGCHGLASPQPGLNKYFFFPGFTQDTGGLLRERDLLTQRDAWRQQGARPPAEDGLEDVHSQDWLRVSLFCYPQAPLAALLAACQEGPRPVHLLVPAGRVLPELAALCQRHRLQAGDELILPGSQPLRISVLPMTDQDGYDRLLWSCDLNVVRGEDSLVRGIWAGVPLLWHIYAQDDDAHHDKLTAFLDHYPVPAAARLMQAWNGLVSPDQVADVMHTSWHELVSGLADQQQAAENFAQKQAESANLAEAMMNFCLERLQ